MDVKDLAIETRANKIKFYKDQIWEKVTERDYVFYQWDFGMCLSVYCKAEEEWNLNLRLKEYIYISPSTTDSGGISMYTKEILQ